MYPTWRPTQMATVVKDSEAKTLSFHLFLRNKIAIYYAKVQIMMHLPKRIEKIAQKLP